MLKSFRNFLRRTANISEAKICTIHEMHALSLPHNFRLQLRVNARCMMGETEDTADGRDQGMFE